MLFECRRKHSTWMWLEERSMLECVIPHISFDCYFSFSEDANNETQVPGDIWVSKVQPRFEKQSVLPYLSPAQILPWLSMTLVVIIQFPGRVWLFAAPWTAACQALLSFTNSWSSLKFMFVESVMLSNHLTLCHPLLLLPSIFPSIRVFSNELALPMRWPEYWSFNFSISPSNEYLGLISLGLTDLLSFQLKRFSTLPQPHSLKVSILWYSAVFMVQLSHLYMTTGKP